MIKKLPKIIIKVLLFLIGIILLLFLALQLPPVQNAIARKVVQQARENLNIPLSVNQVSITFFNRVKVKDVLLESYQGDTIVYASSIRASIKLLPLLENKIHVRNLGLKGVNLNFIKHRGDSLLNIAAVFQSMPEKEKKTSDTSKTPPEMALDQLTLKDINLHFEDKNTENAIHLQLDDFKLRCNYIDLAQKNIELNEITMNGARLNVIQSTMEAAEESEPIPYQLSLEKELLAENINVKITNKITRQSIAVEDINLSASFDSLNLQDEYLAFEKIALKNTSISIVQERLSKTDSIFIDSLQAAQADGELSWRIKSKKLALEQNNYSSTDHNLRDTEEKSNIFQLKNISGEIAQIEIRNNYYFGNIQSFTINVNDQVKISDLKTIAEVNKHSASLDKLQLKTGESNVKLNAHMNYHNLSSINKHLDQTSFYLDLKAQLGAKDLEHYLPKNTFLTKYPKIEAAGSFNGTISEFTMDSFKITAADVLDLKMQGKVIGLPDYKKANGHLFINQLSMNTIAVNNYISDTLIPKNINLPQNINIQGQINGTSNQFKSDINLLTTYGNLNTQFNLNMDSIPEKEYFTSRFELDSFDVGRLVNKQDTIGHLSLSGEVNGHTSNFESPQLTMDIHVRRAGYLGYDYQNISLKGHYKKSFFDGMANIEDEKIAMQFTGKVDLADSIPAFNFHVNIPYAHLHQLNLTPKTTHVSGNLSMDVTGKEWNKLIGILKADSLKYETDHQKYTLDSLLVDFRQEVDSSQYQLRIDNLVQNDSLLTGLTRLDALIRGNNADVNYKIWDEKPAYDTSAALIEGFGDVIISSDTLQINNHLAVHVKNSKLLSNLELDMELSRIQKEENIQELKLMIDGLGARVNASGQIQSIKEEEMIQAKVDVDSLNLALLKPFTKSQLKKLSGQLRGSFDLSGKVSNPDINGELTVINTTVNPYVLNTDFTFEKEKILINNSLITFNELTIQDASNNRAVLDGQVNISQKTSNNLDFTFRANHFQLLNKSAVSSETYYGNVIVNFDASVTGSFENPVINVNTSFEDKSNFHFIVPQQQVNVQKQQEIIQFIEKRKSIDTLQPDEKKQNNLQSADVKNIELNSNLEITDNFRLTIITDPASDERLEIVGNGNLNFSMNKSGNMSLTGRYEIVNGKYRLRLYDFLTREFQIEQGSYLSWSGEILEANANIKAIYKLRTSTINLVQGSGQNNLDVYKQLVPIEVVMNLTGDLLTPQIDFDIRADQSVQASHVQALLSSLNQNESEVNKQAFSLLIFNRFSSESLGGSNAVSYNLQNTAMESLSNVLSEQLNRFSQQYIKGVDVSFDIDSYKKMVSEDASTQTNLNVDLSKNLFSDRLTIEVGGRVAVEESQRENENAVSANNLAGDFRLEYKLTKDGTYRLQAFNQTEYEDEIEGEVTKTGLSLIFNKDFTRINDLFKRNVNPNDTIK